MCKKTLTIYIKTSPSSMSYLYKISQECNCGKFVMPECANCMHKNPCKNTINKDNCVVVDFIKQRIDSHYINSKYTTRKDGNYYKSITLVVHNVDALNNMYEVVTQAIKNCCGQKKQKNKVNV